MPELQRDESDASVAPPSYDSIEQIHSPSSTSMMSTGRDLRSSSAQSIHAESRRPGDNRRRLLLIYIHGFMGDETSFCSFPAHVHNVISITLSQTHVVHSKLYPRYKTKNKLDLVADEFSQWLAPHEDDHEDIILLGHSMGGLLSGEVILLRPKDSSASPSNFFRHRIIGTINFDVPFLGIHPGVISSGLANIFNPPPSKPDEQGPHGSDSESMASSLSRENSLPGSQPTDPTFNPSFANDAYNPVRKGWKSTIHFLTKHSDGLRQATKQYFQAHAEFGGAMADYPSLHTRYDKLRGLEEVSEEARKKYLAKNETVFVPRVRFVNYYTACHGRPKKVKVEQKVVEETGEVQLESTVTLPTWPPLDPPPAEPTAPDLSLYENQSVKDAIKRDYDRRLKTYEQTMSDRDAILAERAEIEKSIRESAGKLAAVSLAEGEVDGNSAVIEPSTTTNALEPSSSQTSALSSNNPEPSLTTTNSSTSQSKQATPKSAKPPKDKRFCVLPQGSHGHKDPTWERVFMPDMDEVQAHTSLFFMSNEYQRLVGDVAGRVEEWIVEVMDTRMAHDIQG
jgi:pimeloyl-ACP methyl ester carboxylesterase